MAVLSLCPSWHQYPRNRVAVEMQKHWDVFGLKGDLNRYKNLKVLNTHPVFQHR